MGMKKKGEGACTARSRTGVLCRLTRDHDPPHIGRNPVDPESSVWFTETAEDGDAGEPKPLSNERIEVIASRAGGKAVGAPATRDEERAMAVEIIKHRVKAMMTDALSKFVDAEEECAACGVPWSKHGAYTKNHAFESAPTSMRFVDQTVFTVPGGNCFSACVATLLGLSLEQVPYFMGELDDPPAEWFERFAKWLASRGYFPINFRMNDWHPPDEAFFILSAGSPRGDWDHSVIARGNKVIVHDPHPSRAGLVRLENAEATLLVPFFDRLRR